MIIDPDDMNRENIDKENMIGVALGGGGIPLGIDFDDEIDWSKINKPVQLKVTERVDMRARATRPPRARAPPRLLLLGSRLHHHC